MNRFESLINYKLSPEIYIVVSWIIGMMKIRPTDGWIFGRLRQRKNLRFEILSSTHICPYRKGLKCGCRKISPFSLTSVGVNKKYRFDHRTNTKAMRKKNCGFLQHHDWPQLCTKAVVITHFKCFNFSFATWKAISWMIFFLCTAIECL